MGRMGFLGQPVKDFCSRPSVPYCNCFPLYIGRLKITIFHFLFSCTMIFSLLWVGKLHSWDFVTFYLSRAISSTALSWLPCMEREPSWLRLVHSLLIFLQFSESLKSIYSHKSYWKPNNQEVLQNITNWIDGNMFFKTHSLSRIPKIISTQQWLIPTINYCRIY